MSFSETSNMTSWPRSRSTSATAMPGKRCPPVPPHAITAFIGSGSSNPRRHSGVHRGAFHRRRFKNALSVNVQQQADPEHTRGQVRTSVADERQRQPLVRQKRRGYADVHGGLKSEKRDNPATKQQAETITSVQGNH